MNRIVLLMALALFLVSCTGVMPEEMSIAGSDPFMPKADMGQTTDVDWANGLFMTQIYDDRWNPDGSVSDVDSNNCGPTSFAMLMSARGVLPAKLTPEMAIDHARAVMYRDYPEIDLSHLPESAHLYEEQGVVFVDDDTHPVYLDMVDGAASISQGIYNGGGEPRFGYSWSDLNALLETSGAVIAHGHITGDWQGRFSGEYGSVGPGAIPHFILLFASSEDGQVIVCDPMHRGGPVSMTQVELQAFFHSPVNPYETTIRVVAWEEASTPDP